MKINFKNEKIETFDDEDINDYETEDDDELEVSNDKILKQIKYFLDNYSKLTSREYYKMICNFYNIKLEDSDYIKYINYKTDNNFNRIIRIETDIIDAYRHVEGHGRDLSWWVVKNRLCLMIAVDSLLEIEDKCFQFNEIKKLIQEEKIYPVDYFYEECDENLKINKIKNDLDYLIKYDPKRRKGDLLINDEYFDYFMKDIFDKVDINYILISIRKYIISIKLDLECKLLDCCFDYEDEIKLLIDEIDKLIDSFNKNITKINEICNLDTNTKLISKDSVEIIVDYLNELSKVNRSEWYQDIYIEQIVNILGNIDYDKNKELCDYIKKIVIKLNEPEICYEIIVCNIDWFNFDKMIEIIINSKNENVCYDVLVNLSNIDKKKRRKLVDIIIDSGNEEINYNIAKLNLKFINMMEHGKVVIDSKNVWYNFLFAQLEGADVRAHGEVIIESRDTYYNSIFPCYVHGADVDRHRQVVIENNSVLEKEKILKKKRTKN